MDMSENRQNSFKQVLEIKKSFSANTILKKMELDRRPIKQLVYIMEWAWDLETRIKFSYN
jgi:hypothetical protein